MKQASIQSESTQYYYNNKTWLYKFMYAFFYGFVQNNDYYYDLKPNKKINIMPFESYTYDTFSVLNTDYNYFCGNMNKLALQNGYFSVSTVSSGVFWKHTATEFETGFDYFGARYYDSDLSIWLSVDPLSDKYPSTSPFMYVLGNPVKYIDPDGERVNLGILSKEHRQKLISELKTLTGLSSIETDKDGYLIYDKSEKADGGSRKARRLLKKSIKSSKDYDVADGAESEHEKSINMISIDFEGIKNSEYSKGLNPLTDGVGMQFFHEASHAFLGTEDPPETNKYGGELGGAVNYTNSIRRQMGKDYSQRTSYNLAGTYDSKNNKDVSYVIFGSRSLIDAKKRQIPTGLYVKYSRAIK